MCRGRIAGSQARSLRAKPRPPASAVVRTRGLPSPGCAQRLLVWLLPLLGAAWPSTLCAAAEPAGDADSPRTAFRAFGFSAAEQSSVEGGEIVSVDTPATQPSGLSAAVAMCVRLPLAAFTARVREGILITADGDLRAFAEVTRAGTGAWDNASYTDGERAEALQLMRVEAGIDLNLSAAEIRSIRDALRPLSPPDRAAEAQASVAYRSVLIGRMDGYRTRGLDGLADYDRGREMSSPARQLRSIDADPRLPDPLRSLAAALDRFPRDQPAGSESRFYWKRTEIADRPAFVLSHVLLLPGPNETRFALVELFASHTYNVLQNLGVALPLDGGTLVLMLNSTVTDRIAGPFGAIARVIGQARTRDALEAYFASIRAALSGPASAGPPPEAGAPAGPNR